MRRFSLCFSLVVACLVAPIAAHAFCGFYVGGGDASLYNNATLVVMMRDGTRTVLSMQNNYQGPPENFAMVVPVPVVLQEENVRTLPPDVFTRVDQMAAPRLVEYWEQDPCNPREWERRRERSMAMPTTAMEDSAQDLGVTIEAQFEVGEYDIVILSAEDSGGLDTWLRGEGYNIPEGAAPVLRPYVASGMKFFVAKVNVERVSFSGGQAMLSPLRFHYDSETFSLPIRLGLLNSGGVQDLLVHILGVNQRYEVANYENVTIPTNINVKEDVNGRFGEFYAALFDRTIERYPGAVVTEYAWNASTCDPCPGPSLNGGDFQTLGADVMPGPAYNFVLTRLHARYSPDNLGEDLIFTEAGPIVGGREHIVTSTGELEEGSRAASQNNFQGRYIIRHPWEGAAFCLSPEYGVWGGPHGSRRGSTEAARDTAFAPRGDISLEEFVRESIPEIGVVVSQ